MSISTRIDKKALLLKIITETQIKQLIENLSCHSTTTTPANVKDILLHLADVSALPKNVISHLSSSSHMLSVPTKTTFETNIQNTTTTLTAVPAQNQLKECLTLIGFTEFELPIQLPKQYDLIKTFFDTVKIYEKAGIEQRTAIRESYLQYIAPHYPIGRFKILVIFSKIAGPWTHSTIFSKEALLLAEKIQSVFDPKELQQLVESQQMTQTDILKKITPLFQKMFSESYLPLYSQEDPKIVIFKNLMDQYNVAPTNISDIIQNFNEHLSHPLIKGLIVELAQQNLSHFSIDEYLLAYEKNLMTQLANAAKEKFAASFDAHRHLSMQAINQNNLTSKIYAEEKGKLDFAIAKAMEAIEKTSLHKKNAGQQYIKEFSDEVEPHLQSYINEFKIIPKKIDDAITALVDQLNTAVTRKINSQHQTMLTFLISAAETKINENLHNIINGKIRINGLCNTLFSSLSKQIDPLFEKINQEIKQHKEKQQEAMENILTATAFNKIKTKKNIIDACRHLSDYHDDANRQSNSVTQNQIHHHFHPSMHLAFSPKITVPEEKDTLERDYSEEKKSDCFSSPLEQYLSSCNRDDRTNYVSLLTELKDALNNDHEIIDDQDDGMRLKELVQIAIKLEGELDVIRNYINKIAEKNLAQKAVKESPLDKKIIEFMTQMDQDISHPLKLIAAIQQLLIDINIAQHSNRKFSYTLTIHGIKSEEEKNIQPIKVENFLTVEALTKTQNTLLSLFHTLEQNKTTIELLVSLKEVNCETNPEKLFSYARALINTYQKILPNSDAVKSAEEEIKTIRYNNILSSSITQCIRESAILIALEHINDIYEAAKLLIYQISALCPIRRIDTNLDPITARNQLATYITELQLAKKIIVIFAEKFLAKIGNNLSIEDALLENMNPLSSTQARNLCDAAFTLIRNTEDTLAFYKMHQINNQQKLKSIYSSLSTIDFNSSDAHQKIVAVLQQYEKICPLGIKLECQDNSIKICYISKMYEACNAIISTALFCLAEFRQRNRTEFMTVAELEKSENEIYMQLEELLKLDLSSNNENEKFVSKNKLIELISYFKNCTETLEATRLTKNRHLLFCQTDRPTISLPNSSMQAAASTQSSAPQMQ